MMAGLTPVGIREAARQMSARGVRVDASTISRQVAAGIIPNRGSAERPRVDVEEAIAARAANLDPAKRRGPGAPLFGRAADALAADPDSGFAAAGAGGPVRASYQDVRTVDASFRAKLTRLEWEQKSGALVSRAEVEAAQMAAARMVRDRLQALARRLAGELASLSDPVAVARRLDDAFRALLADLSGEMQAEADQDAA